MSKASGGTTLDDSAAGGPVPRGHEDALLPVLTIASHPDLARIGDRAFLGELIRGREALLSREHPHFAAPRAAIGEPLGDPFLSRRPFHLHALPNGSIRLRRQDSPIRLAVDGMPVDVEWTVPAAALDDGVVLEVAGRIALLLHRRPAPASFPLKPAPSFAGGLVGESPAIEAMREAISRVAALAVPVLVRGETGTGKELVARALHQESPRARGPFVAVNLGSLPPSLAAAELFGARRGAYTGAVQDQSGYFVRAEGGTLFLDEIGEAPAEVQVMLLRALETGEIVPVGAQNPRWVDVRIVSATDADLEDSISHGGFRAPLLHRLAGYSIRLAPLRERREDIGRLLAWFLRQELSELTDLGDTLPAVDSAEPWLPVPLVSRLVRYAWPGNVRQLQNVVRQLVIDSRGLTVLRAAPSLDALLPEPAAAATPAEPVPPAPVPMPRMRKPSEVSEEELLAALRAHQWNLKATAAALGIARTSLYILLEQSSRVRSASDIPPEEVRAAFARCGGDLEALAAELEISERALRQRLKDLGLR